VRGVANDSVTSYVDGGFGKFHDSAHDFELSVAAMRYNDPAGAMLAWRGWVVSSRQSFAGEELSLPDLDTGYSPYESKPFTELDHRTGYHVTTQWDWHDHGRVLAGYYDNRADPRVVDDLQWAWTTRFAHIGIKWQLPYDIEMTCPATTTPNTARHLPSITAIASIARVLHRPNTAGSEVTGPAARCISFRPR
jgi:hypothetical protein